MNANFALGADKILRCTAWDKFEWQSHGFGTRISNPLADITLRQVHSDRVLYARGLTDRCCEGDALVSDVTGQSIGVRTADCVPLLFLDPEHHVVAAIHAGWRGTVGEIAVRALEGMRTNFNTDTAAVHAAIGPAIQACCYEVGPEVAARFEQPFRERPLQSGGRKVDLPEANRRQLVKAGIPEDHIYNCGLCTYCESDLFFSFRREPENPGRMLTSISVVI